MTPTTIPYLERLEADLERVAADATARGRVFPVRPLHGGGASATSRGRRGQAPPPRSSGSRG